MTVLALVIPLGSIALASHSGTNDNQHTLEVTPETDSNPTGTTHTLTALVSGNCQNGCEVDFEIESGPATRVNVTGDQGQGGTANNDGDSPTTPDMTCTATGTNATCTVTFTSDTAGTNVIRAWVDDDRDNASVDADRTEGADAGDGADEPAGGTNTPGTRTEPDDTDVVTKTWFAQIAAGATLDCNPETATNPSTGADSAETYTCTLFNDNGAGGGTAGNGIQDGGEAGIAGVPIDGENLGGANDPDTENAGGNPAVGPNVNTADYDCGTTNATGQTTCTVAASEGQAGTANICFWADNDNDNVYNPAGDQNDGGDCDAEARADVDSDITDVVTKTWAARGVAANIDCEPENDQNVIGTSHTVTCTVTDQFGDPVQGAFVDFEVTGKNTGTAGTTADNRTTNAAGQVTFTYTDDNTAPTPEGEQDTIRGCIDPDPVAGCAGPATGPQEVDEDAVNKFWFTTLPTVGDVVIDMRPDLQGCEGTDATAEDTATNQVSTDPDHRVCATVLSNANPAQPIPGEPVTFTLDGPGTFFDDEDNDGVRDTGEESLGQSITVATDANGQAFASFTSTATGNTTVTATADGQSDSGVKTFANQPDDARNIDCEPETATNAPGTEHVVTCTVTDRFGNPVPNADVDFTETGPGRVQSEDTTTNANGQAEAVISTTTTESGDQTITGQLRTGGNARTDVGGTNDACEQAAGNVSVDEGDNSDTDTDNAANAPAGNCADDVAKTWGAVEPQPECNDGIDNDGDGEIDFPADDGCESAQDDDESDFPHQEFGGDTGQPVTEGACTGFLTGSVQADPDGNGLVVVGTNGNDALQGSEAGDLICALAGDDAVQGHGGNDTIFGGGGKDAIEAGAGDDTVFGEGDKDVILGDDGNDELDGGQGNDNMSGGGGADVLLGRGGWDTLKGNAGDDLLVGAKGRDILQGGAGNDTVRGGADDDVLKGYIGNDVIRGGGGDDILRGGAGRDRLFGNAGDDIINGGAGRDRCRGGRGNDILRNCP